MAEALGSVTDDNVLERNPSMTTRHVRALAVALLALTAACAEDPIEPEGFATDELTTDLAITPDHVHIYETLVTFTVSVVDPDGAPVTDFEVVQVERRAVGGATWSVMEAALDGDFYVVDHTFEASGMYDIRVTGLRESDTDLVVLYEAPAPLEAVRVHEDVGGYHVELEPDPGHIHEGDSSDIRYWIVDEDTEVGITGLTPTIWVEESDGTTSEYAAAEGADGLYHASHAFSMAGTTVLGIRFIGSDQMEAEWSLEIEVHEAH